MPSRPGARPLAALLLCAAASLSCAGARARGGEGFTIAKGSPLLVLGFSKDFAQEGWEDERVVAAGAPRSSASLGPLHARSRSTTIDVEITIQDMRAPRALTAPGRGSALRASGSAVFDLRGKEVALDKSTIGTATVEAIRNAVRALADGIVVTEPATP